jgi:hypothetical protein
MNDKKDIPGTEHRMTYRQEILSKFFDFIKSADSFYVVGAASMGKTRLLDFLMLNDVQEYYLKNESQSTWLVRVDLNRMPDNNDWDFHFLELLLSSLALCGMNRKSVNEDLVKEILALDSEVIESRDMLRALRFLEWGVSKICQAYDIKICFLFDEFDEAYRTMPPKVFAQLRAIRDANKSCLLYAMFLRVPPQNLRPGSDNESFYELLSGNALGIGPYDMTDTLNIIQNLENDWNMDLPSDIKEKIGMASGGHPGIVKALMRLAKDSAIVKIMENKNWIAELSNQRTIIDECKKIWLGLQKEEKLTLLAPLQGEKNIDRSVADLLVLKGVLKDGHVFSPFFEYYLRSGLAKIDA